MLLRAVLFRAVLHRAVIWFLLLSAWPAMVAAAGIPIVGQVLDPDGEPRSKVAVHLEPIPSTYERAKLRLGGQPGPEPVASTRTGSDGTFEIAAPEQGMWKVVASPRGMLTVEFRLIPLVEAAVLPAVKLTPAADLEVRLIDEQKQPLSGRVGATALNVRGSGWRPQLRLATAGDDGVARLPLGRDEKIQLEILADGHPLRVYEVIDESSVEIKVPAGVAGTVRVTDREKRSLEGAIAYQGSALLPLGMSDAEGQLPLVLQADRIRAVRMVTAERWHGSFELDFAKSEGKVESLRLEPPVTLRGRVLDTANRDPVGGAVVWAVRGELAVTDARGGYALDMGAYKSRWVQGVAAGYQPGRSQVRDGGATETPAIALAPAASLSGRVVDADGAPIGGVAIDLTLLPGPDPFSPALQRMRAGWRGTTSSGGTFQVTGLAAGVGYQLEFERAGFAPRRLEVEPLEPFQQRAKLEVVLRPGRLAVGRVVDEDDVPVASAEVVLELPPPTNDLQAMIRTVRRPEDEGIEPSFLTDGEGRFEIPDLAAGRYDLAVRAAGFAPAKVPGLRISQGDGRVDFGTVVLVPGAVIEGRVIDADGAAVAEVEITADLSRPGFSRGGHKPGELGQARSGQDGRFAIVDLLPDQALNLTATKKGYGIAVVTELRPPTSEPVVIELHPAGQMVGKVVDERDRPIPRATVSANPDHRSMTAATMSVMRRPTWARTDEEGLFAIEDVGPGTLEVNIHAEGYQRQMRTGIEVAAGAVVELEVVLRAGSVVEGLVTTEEGKPVARASVNATERTQSVHGIAGVSAGGQTDVEGRYRFEGAPIGAAMINVRHQNRQIKKNVELRPGTNVVDLVLEGGFTVTGQVVTPDGSSVGGAAVAIQESVRAGMHFSFGSHSKVVSNAAGLFTLEGITEGQYVVTASREGWAPARSEPFEVSNDVTGLLLELSRGSTLEGQVVGLEFDELGSLSLMAFSQAGGMRQGRVDFEARYAFDDLAPGQWNITAQVAGSGRQVTLQVEIPEGVGQVEKAIEFGTGFTLTGIVLDGEQPLAGVNVSANSATGGSGHGVSGTDGRFRIEGLPAGSYYVMVMAGVGAQHTQIVEIAGDEDVRIELSTGALSGTVRDAVDGTPLAGASVALELLDAPTDPLLAGQFQFGEQLHTDSQGYFRAARIRQGTWRLVATREGYGPGESTAVVTGGTGPTVEIRLTPTEGVSFEVAMQSGRPISGVAVALFDLAGRRVAASTYAVIDGRARVSMVPPGRWELVIQAEDSAAVRFTVNAPGDQGRFVLPTGGTLNLRIPELEKVPAAQVELTGPDGKPFTAVIGFMAGSGQLLMFAGQAMVPGLIPGPWTFTVRHEDQTWNGSATVSSGATTEVSLP